MKRTFSTPSSPFSDELAVLRHYLRRDLVSCCVSALRLQDRGVGMLWVTRAPFELPAFRKLIAWMCGGDQVLGGSGAQDRGVKH